MEVHRRLQLRVVDSSEEFYKLKQSWDKILCELSEYPPFLTWEWMYTWWEIYKTNATKLLLLVVSDNDDIVAIVPFYVRKSAFLIPCNTIYFLGTGEPESKEVCSEYLDFISMPSYAKAVSSTVKAYFAANNKTWDCIELHRILGDSALLNFFLQDMAGRKYTVQQQKCGFRYFIALPDQWETYIKSLNSSMRRSITVAQKKLLQTADYKIEVIETESQIQGVMRELIELHTERWQAKGKLGAFASREFREFHLKIAELFQKKNMLQILKISIEHETIAILYNFRVRSCIYYYQSGLNLKKYASHKPGVLLHSEAIKNAFANKMKKYDFMMASKDSYKSQYGCVTREMFHISIWNRGMKAKILQKLALLPYFKRVKQ